MKFFQKILDNSLFIFTIFLVAFIPLYPKLPLLGITGTWVYIRLEDVFLALAGILFVVQTFRKKTILNTPLTPVVLAFWIIGAISTIFAVIFIFPQLANVSPKLAFFNYARRIEYLLPFFIAVSAINDKKKLKPLIITFIVTVVLICLYGFGQKIDPSHFFAFSTMNEEFAKGVPLQLSAAARIPSTFAGHYDLAAYLVLLIPLIGSLVIGVKSWFHKMLLLVVGIAGLCLLLLTESRVSFAVYLLAISFMLFISNMKRWIIPIFIGSILIAIPFQGFVERFSSTITQVDQVVDARTGKVIGAAKPDQTGIVIEDTLSTGENLPQGSSYINLPGTGTKSDATSITIKRLNADGGLVTDELKGEFSIKKGYAFDVSWTTRFQGEWPRALEAFKRNILLGSGYSSISLATDGDYLRLLGEVGLLGAISFMLIFVTFYVYTYKVIPDVEDPLAKSYVLGVCAGIFGLLINAVLIDVFEASKVAYTSWFLIGSATAVLVLYQKKVFAFTAEMKKVLLSPVAISIYLFALVIGVWSVIMGNSFVADDFTWLRWVADCKKVVMDGLSSCETTPQTFIRYFTESEGFFYRPGAKALFLILFAFGSLMPFIYHLASLIFHALTCVSLFFLLYFVTKRKLLSTAIVTAFILSSGYHEAIFWISSIGHVIASYCIVGGLLYYVLWKEKKQIVLLLLSLLHVFAAPMFQEVGIVAPIFVICYICMTNIKSIRRQLPILGLYIWQTPVYLLARYFANSHWSGGDYSYNVLKLPFNIFGNSFGAAMLGIFGVSSLPYYNSLRQLLKEDLLIAGFVGIGIVLVVSTLGITMWKKLSQEIRNLFLFFFMLFIIPLLPVLGLGNIAERYSYLATVGILGMVATLGLSIWEESKNRLVIGILFSVLFIGYTTFHFLEIQRLHKDWHKAGIITQNAYLGTSILYKTEGEIPNSVYYYVDTPTRYGSAWVFPVGLNDAIWLDLQNKPLTVLQKASLDDALKEAKSNANARVLRFNKAGELEALTTEE